MDFHACGNAEYLAQINDNSEWVAMVREDWNGKPMGYGVGPLSPAASNKTDEGRAYIRRVELVEQ